MSYLKKYGLKLLLNILEIIFLLFVATIFYYFDILDENSYKFMKLLILLITIFINSFSLGKNSNKNGYVEGTKYGIILITLSFIPTIIASRFNLKTLIFYLIIISISIFGSVFGINKKKNKE